MNFIKNSKSYCAGCEWQQYCRGRNKNLLHFAEDREPDQYFCDLTKGLFEIRENEKITTEVR